MTRPADKQPLVPATRPDPSLEGSRGDAACQNATARLLWGQAGGRLRPWQTGGPPEPTARGIGDKGPPCDCVTSRNATAPHRPAGPRTAADSEAPTETIRFPHLPWQGYGGRNFSQAPRGCHLLRSFRCVIPAPPSRLNFAHLKDQMVFLHLRTDYQLFVNSAFKPGAEVNLKMRTQSAVELQSWSRAPRFQHVYQARHERNGKAHLCSACLEHGVCPGGLWATAPTVGTWLSRSHANTPAQRSNRSQCRPLPVPLFPPLAAAREDAAALPHS